MKKARLTVLGSVALSLVAAQRGFCADVAGLVTDTQARPVAKVTVLVTDGSGKLVREGHSTADGRYRITGLAVGNYNYVVDPAAEGFQGGGVAGYLGPKGLTIDWQLAATTPALALATEGSATELAGDPFGMSALAFTGAVAAGVAVVSGGVVGGLAAAGGFNSPASPSL